MCEFDNGPIEPNKMFQWHAESQRHEKPCKNVAWRNVRKQGIILHHRYGVDGEKKPEGTFVSDTENMKNHTLADGA